MPKAMLKNLPQKARDIWEAAFEAAQKDGYNEERAGKIAWGAVKRAGFRRSKEGSWSKMELAPFYITKAVKGRDGVMRWAATVSEFAIDRQGDEMTPGFIKAAVGQIEAGLRPAPVLCVSHIDHGKPSDKWVAGDVTDLYIDGETPKAKGTFRDTPLGQAVFNAVREDWREKRPTDERARISMGFFANEIQPLELKTESGATLAGRRFLSGWVKHLAITRVPVVKSTSITAEMELKNMAPKTKKQDAATIVGDELAEELVDLAVKSDLEADTPDMILKQTGEEDPAEAGTVEKFADQAPAKVGPGAAGKAKAKKKRPEDEEEETPEELEEGEEEEEEEKKKKPEAKAEVTADHFSARMDQVEALLSKLAAALGLEEIQPEEMEANRVALGNTGTNPPTTVKGEGLEEMSEMERFNAQLTDGWGDDEDHEEDPDGEIYEFGDLSDYGYTVIRFVDDWGDRVKAALLSDGDRTEKVAAVQKALYDFGDGIEGLIRDATPPSSRDLADVVAEAVRAAVTPVYNELAAVKAEVQQYRAGNAEGQGLTPKALDSNAIVLETALQHLTNQPAGQPPAGLGRPRGPVAKSASELSWESTDPAMAQRPY